MMRTTQLAELCNTTRATIHSWVKKGFIRAELTKGRNFEILEDDAQTAIKFSKMLRINEVKDLAGVDENTVRNYARKGIVRAYKFANRTLFEESSVNQIKQHYDRGYVYE